MVRSDRGVDTARSDLMRAAGAVLAIAIAAGIGVALHAIGRQLSTTITDYPTWQAEAFKRPLTFVRWLIGDMTEAEFYKSALGGLLMVAGALVAYWLWKRRKPAGFAIAYGSGLIPWMLLAAFVGLLLSNIAWGWSVPATGKWQPTFVPFVSVPPAIVLIFGRGWKVAGTGAILGAALTTPIALLVVNYVCEPLELPGVIGNVTGMWGGALIAFWLCRYLSWMPKLADAEQDGGDAGKSVDSVADSTAEPSKPLAVRESPARGIAWGARRVLADFTEAQFYGNEIASIGLIAGTIIMFLLDPAGPVYGSGLFPSVLAAQALGAGVGVAVYARQWGSHGWYPTFIPVVSVGPAVVLTFGGSVSALIVGSIAGGLMCAPVAAWISRRLPAGFHPFIGNVMSMTICTALIVSLMKLVW